MKAISILSAATLALLVACDDTSNNNTGTTPNRTPDGTTAPNNPPPANNQPRQPDNTGNNERDRSATNPTPLDQSNDSRDIEITAEIRRAVVDDAAMSTNAKNIKIITAKGGVVTLRGVVDSEAEKDSIEAKAKAVAGVQSVDNQLEVKAP